MGFFVSWILKRFMITSDEIFCFRLWREWGLINDCGFVDVYVNMVKMY